MSDTAVDTRKSDSPSLRNAMTMADVRRLMVSSSGEIGVLRFHVDDIEFSVHHSQKNGKCDLQIVGALGYMPFSAESPEKREALSAIVSQSRGLTNVRFIVGKDNKILVGGRFGVPHIQSADVVFYPLVQFMQEAKPFIDLIGKHL